MTLHLAISAFGLFFSTEGFETGRCHVNLRISSKSKREQKLQSAFFNQVVFRAFNRPELKPGSGGSILSEPVPSMNVDPPLLPLVLPKIFAPATEIPVAAWRKVCVDLRTDSEDAVERTAAAIASSRCNNSFH